MARKKLGNAYYETELGKAYLGDSLEIMKDIPDNSVDLVLTSPPFALTRQKEYGNKQEEEYLIWFLNFTKEFYRIIKPTGSVAIDLGGAYLPGYPTRSIYQYELLVRLCKEQKFFSGTRIFPLQSSKTTNSSRVGKCSQNPCER